MQSPLVLTFDHNTIEHLGISLYSQLPSVLAELISNSWDADAENSSINFIDNNHNKEIAYTDDGCGMSLQELQDKYLVIGRNRRVADPNYKSKKGRKVIGKKGLGKLSVFGICDIMEVISVKDGLKNHFIMNLQEIRQSTNTTYSPNAIEINSSTDEKNGLTLILKKIRRKSPFDLNAIALSLSKKFLIFDEMTTTLLSNGNNKTPVTNELKFQELNTQFKWEFPEKSYDESYEFWEKISGTIYTLETPVKDPEIKGIFLTSRGKMVNIASFYGARDNDQFHAYLTGYLEVDFIDDFEEDVISTARLSLNWEHDKTKELQNYIQKIIKKIGSEWRVKRRDLKKSEIKIVNKVDVTSWQDKLPTFEKNLSDKIINPVLENSNIDIKESTDIISHVIEKFNDKTFKDYASSIADSCSPEDIPNLLKLINEWKLIEATQFKNLAHARIEVIKKFEEYIESDTKEVPTLHNFIKQFSWLLDPRILEFKDEVTYSKLLKENYPEEKIDESNKRIDFLCSSALGEILYVIEIKRSKFKIDYNALEQAYDYGVFLNDRYSSESGFSKVVCYVIGGEKKSEDRLFRSKEQTYRNTGEVFVKTYVELLEQSKEYHKEFLEEYEKHNNSISF